MAFDPDKFLPREENKTGFDPNRFLPAEDGPSPAMQPSPQIPDTGSLANGALSVISNGIDKLKKDPPKQEISTDMQGRIERAYAEGDVQLAEFLTKAARDELKTPEPEDRLGKIGAGLRQFGERAQFEVGRRYETMKEKVTGEKRKTELTEFPELVNYGNMGGVYNLAADMGVDTSDIPKAISEGDLPPPASQADMGRMTAFNLSSDDSERAQIARNLSNVVGIFPDTKGNAIALFNNGFTMPVNRPGLSETETSELGSKTALYALGSAAGGSGVYGQMLGAMGSQAAMEGATYLAGGTFEPWEIALAPVFEAGGIGAGKLISKALIKLDPTARATVKNWTDLEGKIPDRDFNEIKGMMSSAEQLDAPALSGAQVMSRGKAADQGKRIVKAIAKNDKEAAKLAAMHSAQDNFSDQRIRKEVADIFDSDDAIGAGMEKTRLASDKVFEQLKKQRDEVSKKTFGKAFEANDGQGGVVDYRPVRAKINEILAGENRGSSLIAPLKKALTFMQREAPNKTVYNITGQMGRKAQQQVKFQLDELIKNRTDTTVGNQARKALLEVQDILVGQIEKTNKGYKAANAKYASDTAPIDEVQDSILGIYKSTEEAAEGRIANLFNNKSINTIKKVKGYLDSVDPAAFPALYRGWLDSRVSKMGTTQDLMELKNPAQRMYDVFFKNVDETRKIMELAPTKKTKQNMMALKEYLGAAKQLRLPDVQAEQAITELKPADIVRGVVLPKAEAAARAFSFVKGGLTKRRLRALGDAITNPKWATEMEKARLAGIRSGQMDILFNRILLEIAQAEKPSAREISEKPNETDSE